MGIPSGRRATWIRAVAASAFLLAGLPARGASAETAGAETSSLPPAPDAGARADPLLFTGLALTGTAVGTWVLGGVSLASAEDLRSCSKAGCSLVNDVGANRRGSALMGASLGAVVVALPMALAGLGAAPPASARRSEPRMVVGAVLTDLGAGFLGASVSLVAWKKNRAPAEIPLFTALGGVTSLAVGIPLWATGQSASRVSASGVEATGRAVEAAHAADGGRRMEIAGFALSLIGAGGAITGGVLIASADTRGDFGGFAVIPGLAVAGVSATILATGIPLWVSGARRSSRALFSAAPAALTVAATGTGISVSGSY